MRGGKRPGAGRPPVPTGQEKMTNYTIRTYKHERPIIRQYLKQLRQQNEKENGGDNTQTFREFIVESEKEFGFNNESIDMFTDEGLNKYIYFLDYLYEK